MYATGVLKALIHQVADAASRSCNRHRRKNADACGRKTSRDATDKRSSAIIAPIAIGLGLTLIHEHFRSTDEALRMQFPRQVLETLRQPIETGDVVVARANAHVRYPCRFMLVAAANPCRCGHGGAGKGACGKAPRCQRDYQNRISGPMFDRIDLTVETPPVTAADMALPPPAEGTAEASARVLAARAMQGDRLRTAGIDPDMAYDQAVNARASGETLDRFATPDEAGRALLMRAGQAGGLTARGWTRTLRLARTIADLDGCDGVLRRHIAEALVYRRATVGAQGDFERQTVPDARTVAF